jgi:serine/threonine protein kinase
MLYKMRSMSETPPERSDPAAVPTAPAGSGALAKPAPRLSGLFEAARATTYTVQNEIGRGGMGRVVRAFDRRLGRAVALKELRAPDAERR